MIMRSRERGEIQNRRSLTSKVSALLIGRFLWPSALILILDGATLAFGLPPPTNLRVVEAGDGWARLRWDAVNNPTLKGYRLKYSLEPGSHPLMSNWNGYPAAFTFSTDDAFDDNLTWMRVFDRHGKHFTIFAPSTNSGWTGYLSVSELDTLQAHGHEIGSHSYSHPFLIRNTAFTIRYQGSEAFCSLEIVGGALRTYLSGGELDLSFGLGDPAVAYLDQLVDSIDARPSYTCVFDYYPGRLDICSSVYLDDVSSVDIAAGPWQATTSKGSDSLAMFAEVVDSKAYFESVLSDSSYRCRTFAYPFHAHDQREMNALMEAGYIGARDGGIGPYPAFSPVLPSYLNRVSTYQTPLTCCVAGRDTVESSYRQKIRQRIAGWKAQRLWANYFVHSLADWDSTRMDWALDEIVADGGVWLDRFDNIAAYVRQFHVTVDNPVEAWNDSAMASAVLCELPVDQWVYVVAVAYDSAGVESAWSNEVALIASSPPVGVGVSERPITRLLWLGEGRPNPMSSASTVSFSVARPIHVSLGVYSISGSLASRLLDEEMTEGRHEVHWDGSDGKGGRVGSGVYFLRLSAEGQVETRRVVLLR